MSTLIGPCPECGRRSYIPREFRVSGGRWCCPSCERLHAESRHADAADVFGDNGPTAQALVPLSRQTAPQLSQPALPQPPARFTDRASLFADINQLLDEATTPITDRRRTFFEWLRGIDPRAEQIARKMAAAKTADELVVQRTVLFKHLQQMVTAMADAEVATLEAQIKVQQARLVALELEDKINERLALRDVRLQVQRAVEAKRLREHTETGVSERERVLEEHRENRQARLRASDEMLQDFLGEVRQVCDSRASIHERALRLQNLLSVFEMPEDALPADAVWILKASERIRDAS